MESSPSKTIDIAQLPLAKLTSHMHETVYADIKRELTAMVQKLIQEQKDFMKRELVTKVELQSNLISFQQQLEKSAAQHLIT